MKRKPVICLGCAFWDTIFKIERIPGHGAKVLPEKAVQVASGMATAAAVTIARLGGHVELWARVGDDPTGESFLRDLSHEAVRIDRIRRVEGARTAFSTILVDREGERLVVPYTDPSLDPDPSWLPLQAVADAAAVLVDMRWPEGARALLAEARRCGVPTVLDADVSPPEALREMMTLADHVLFSEPALLSLSDRGTPGEALRDVAAGIEANVVGVTLGAAGALIWQRGGSGGDIATVPSIPVRAVDTLNAGDVWHGTYVYGLVNDWNLEPRVRMANMAAAMKCEHFGGRLGSPTLDQLLERSRASP
ncbi:PfkB family carbohydrate kinase [Microvirga sesbaniae]|uniref:PfkB family carbohydrate kinase n=1 Tax=Microvirga sesbaniae TaxID=681392 RepID=UPI0021C7D824|nr:PfkB family carbohydrate kinase [Microvirga sp. HBU67692]